MIGPIPDPYFYYSDLHFLAEVATGSPHVRLEYE